MRPELDPEWPMRSLDYKNAFYVSTTKRGGGMVFGYPRITTMPLSKHSTMTNHRSGLQHGMAVAAPTGSCKVWHISLNDLRSIDNEPTDIPLKPGPRGNYDHPVLEYRNDLWNLVTRIKTDFNFVGPELCEKKLLKDAMFDAAHVLIQEDRGSLSQACSWFRDTFGEKFETCGKIYEPLLQKSLPLEINPIKGGRNGLEVSCSLPSN